MVMNPTYNDCIHVPPNPTINELAQITHSIQQLEETKLYNNIVLFQQAENKEDRGNRGDEGKQLEQQQQQKYPSFLLIDLNKQLLSLLKRLQQVKKMMMSEEKGTEKREQMWRKKRRREYMIKISMICSCLHMIYQRCSWTALHSLLLLPSHQDEKDRNSQQNRDRYSRRTSILNALLLVLDTFFSHSSLPATSTPTILDDTTSITNYHHHDIKDSSIRNVICSKVLSILARMSFITNLYRGNTNKSLTTYMLQVVQQPPPPTCGSTIPFHGHIHAITIFANLVYFDLHIKYEEIQSMMDYIMKKILVDDNDGDKNDNLTLLFRQEAWRLILHVVTSNHTRHYIADRVDVMDLIHSTISMTSVVTTTAAGTTAGTTATAAGNEDDDDDDENNSEEEVKDKIITDNDKQGKCQKIDVVYEQMIAIALLKKIGGTTTTNNHKQNIAAATDNDDDDDNREIVKELCHQAMHGNDIRVVDASLFALCEILNHHTRLYIDEQSRLVTVVSCVLVDQREQISGLCHAKAMKLLFHIAKNINAFEEDCWKVIETLFILAHENPNAKHELCGLCMKVCRIQTSRMLANIGMALMEGTQKMKYLASSILKRMSRDKSIARMMVKDNQMSKVLVSIVVTSDSSNIHVDNIIRSNPIVWNCTKAILALIQSTSDIYDLVQYKDVLTYLVVQATELRIYPEKNDEDGKYMNDVKKGILSLSQAMLLEQSSV